MLKAEMESMVALGLLRRAGNRRYVRVSVPNMRVGTLTMTRQGYGFVALESAQGQGDVYITGRALRGAMHRDRVEINVFESRPGKLEGDVIRVIERGTHTFVGFVHQARKAQWITPRDERLPDRIRLIGEATHGQLIAARFINWPGPGHPVAEAEIVRVFAQDGRAAEETEIVVYDLGLPMQFSQATLAEAEALPEPEPPPPESARVDLRDRLFFTVDPQSARDFDDAVYAERREDGGWRLSVAVADVSHYIQPDSDIDAAAFERSFSVYLPDRVLPMLPERLSADLCSLRPNVDRYAMVVEMSISPDGEFTSYNVMAAMIRSRLRLSYDRCADLLGLVKPATSSVDADDAEPYLEAMRAVLDVTRTLRRRRQKKGYLALDVPEAQVTLAEDGDVSGLHFYERHEAHLMVEDAMLAANVCVADFFVARGLDSVFRTHGPPPESGLDRFFLQMRALDFNLPRTESAGPLSAGLGRLKGDRNFWLANMLLLRAMARAEYTPKVDGHFGLGFEAYLHFTSPIRRYSDLTVHRLIKRVLAADEYDDSELELIAAHCSRRERIVLDAEREVIGLYKALYMEQFLNEELPAIISGIGKNGMFIHFTTTHCDAFIPIADLRDDWFDVDENLTMLVGRHTGNRYCLGDRIMAQVTEVSVSKRRVTARSLGPISDSS
ncbi:MAG: hypothetical protein CMH52_09765 [Myxococcales bacterium]|nr:hypothetical protein [Myxococcales bacterium]